MSLLDDMKVRCGKLDGIYCEKTKENEALLIAEGYRVWGEHLEGNKPDDIYVIDKEDLDKEYIGMAEERDNYRLFEFKEGVPTFLEKEK